MIFVVNERCFPLGYGVGWYYSRHHNVRVQRDCSCIWITPTLSMRHKDTA